MISVGMDYEGNLCGLSEQVDTLDKLWAPSSSGTLQSSLGLLTPVCLLLLT